MEDGLYNKFLRNAIKTSVKKFCKKKKIKKIQQPSQNSTRQKGETKQGPNKGSTDMRRYCTIFSPYGDLATGNL
jgi:hypothetical protein